MKKNFFKKLSFVTAFALVATAVAPAGLASAATTPNLAERYATVYEGASRSYAVKNATGYTVKWTVSGEGAEYASLTKTSGAKTALSVDTEGELAAKNANVTVRANFYKDGKLVKSAGDVVTVKVNATALDITTDADVEAVPAGETVDFNRKITPANATSTTYWSVTDKDGKATTNATIDGAGNFKATKVGEYIVVAEAKNAKDGVVKAEDSQTVKVVLKMTKVELKAVSKVELTFNDSVKGITASDIVITNTATKVRVPVKSVSLSADEKVVTAEIYDKFVNAKEYTVAAKESTLDFTAVIGSIDSIELLDQVVLPNTPTALKFRVLDANGVDISANYVLGSTIQVQTTNSYFVSAAGVVTFTKDGDFAKVTLSNTQYDITTGAVNTIKSAEATIIAGTPSVSSVKSWVINSSALTADFTNDKQVLTADQTGKYLHVKALKGTSEVTTGFSFTSLDETYLVVDKATGQLFPQKAGSVLVKVEIGAFVDYITIVIDPSRAASTLTSDLTAGVSLSNSLATADSYSVKFTLKDQYNNAIAYTATPTVTTYNNEAVDFVTAVGTANAAAGTYTVVFTAVNTKTGTTSFKVTIGDKYVMVPVSVVAPGASTGYAAVVDDTTIDPHAGDTANLTVYVMSGNVKRDIVTSTAYSYEVTDSTGAVKVASTTYSDGVLIPTAALADGVYTVYVKNGSALVATTSFTVKTTKPVATLETVKISTSVKTSILAAIDDAFNVIVSDASQTITGATFISLDTAQIPASATTASAVAITADTQIYVQTITVAGYTVNVNKVLTITK